MTRRSCIANVPLVVAACIAAPAYAADSAAPVPAVPVSGGTTSIDDIGYCRVSYRYTDGRGGVEPLGWTGHFEAATGISATPYGTQDGKRAYLLHPIWRGGTGDTDQEYRLTLPGASAISLQFSIAMKADAAGKSDGVTFRLYANGEKLLDRHKSDAAWTPFRFDLTRYAGRTVALRFEADPGPKGDPSFDYGLWGDRRLVLSGAQSTHPMPLFAPPTAALDAPQAGWKNASPTHAAASSGRKPITSACEPAKAGLFDGLRFRLTPPGHSPSSIDFGAGGYLDLIAPDGRTVPSYDPRVQAVVQQKTLSSTATRRTAVYTIDGRRITVVAEISRYDGSSVRVRLRSADPYIAGVHFGSLGPTAYRRTMAVPYYGTVDYAPLLGLFSNTAIDFSLSHASSLDGAAAYYAPLTDGRRNPIDETAYYALSPDIHAVWPTPPSPASPYRQTMGDRVVLDMWSGPFDERSRWLKTLASYGLDRFFVIVHDWQHGGYDNQLPDVLPANAAYGGNAALRDLTATARGFGELIGLHENYVDFYPNAPSYNTDDLALLPDGKFKPAWQQSVVPSFLMTPTAMRKYAARITPLAHRELGTNGSYLDVHSAIPPWDHPDARPDRPDAGSLQACWKAQRDLWQLMRDVHGGPVLGEGANHWYWSGLLDGVEAQFGVGVPGNGGETAPLFVDFDLLKIHPLQINHGMGYIERWLDGAHANAVPTAAQIDLYRMQEIAFGHSGFVGDRLIHALPFVWEEQNLVVPVSAQTAAAHVTGIRYEVNGRLIDTNSAIAAGAVFDRVRVDYDNGMTIWANGRNAPWTIRPRGVSAAVIPRSGWLAMSPTATAWTAARNGRTVSYARTPTTIFADARPISVTAVTGLRVRPRLLGFSQTGPRALAVQFGFDVREGIASGYRVFVHVVSRAKSAGEGIAMQLDAGFDAYPHTWPLAAAQRGRVVRAGLPADMPDGDYDIRVGLYSPQSGDRLILDGADDGGRRYTVGSFHVRDGGRSIAAEGVPGVRSAADMSTEPLSLPAPAVAGPMIDFGPLATNGSVLLRKVSSGVWTLTPMPRDEAFTVVIYGASIDPSLVTFRASIIDLGGHVVRNLGEIKPAAGKSSLRIDLPPGGTTYRLERAG